MQHIRLIDADLTNANLSSADLFLANLTNANLANANLHLVDLSGSILTGVNLTGAFGLGTREGEIEFAKHLLGILSRREGTLDQSVFHSKKCATTHCIAGWAYPERREPAAAASRLYPTLSQYFYATDEEALKALELVASGELSVFSD